MLTHFFRRITQAGLNNNTFIALVAIQCLYTSNNTYQDSKKQKQETYRFKKIKFTEIRSKITKKPKHSLCSQHRTKNVPKTYRNTKKRTLWYGFKLEKINEFSSNREIYTNSIHTKFPLLLIPLMKELVRSRAIH